jgi:hypothetical protein
MAVRSISRLNAVLAENEDDPDDWEAYDVPGSKRSLFLPDPTNDEWWSVVVDELVVARGAQEASGPWMSERRETICRSGHVYFLDHDHDGDHELRIVGQYTDERRALAAATATSTAFVIGGTGAPVSVWVDPDEDDPEVDDEIDDEDEDEIDDEDDDEDDAGPGVESEGMIAWRRLSGTTVKHESGLVLAGKDAAGTLPSDRRWVAIPSNNRLHASIAARVSHSARGTIRVDGVRLTATLTDQLAPVVALRIGTSWGCRAVYQLDRDSISEIDVARSAIVARTLRQRP